MSEVKITVRDEEDGSILVDFDYPDGMVEMNTPSLRIADAVFKALIEMVKDYEKGKFNNG